MYPTYHRPHRFLWSLVLVGLVIFVIKAPSEAAYLAHLGLGLVSDCARWLSVDIFEEAVAPRAPASSFNAASAPRRDQPPGSAGLTGDRLRSRPGRRSGRTA